MSTTSQPGTIGFSRTLGLLDALAIGLSIAWSLATYVIGPEVLDFMGREAPLVFLLGAAFFVIVSLALLALSSETPGSADLYELARLRGSRRLAHSVGWSALGGYLCLSLLLAGGVGERVALLLGLFFARSVDLVWLVAGVIVLTGLVTLVSGLGWSRVKTRLVLACLAVPIVVLILAFVSVPSGSSTSELESKAVRHWLIPVALLASALWALDPLLAQRGRLKRPNRTSIAAISLMWIVVFVFCTSAVVLVLSRPDLAIYNWEDQLTWTENRLELLALLSGIAACWIGLSRIAVSAIALTGQMARDGFLPRRLAGGKIGQDASVLAKLSLLGLLGATLAAHFGDSTLASLATILLTIVITLLLLPDTLKKESELAEQRRIRFPLHPIVPGVAIAGMALLSLLAVKQALVPLLGWIATGLLVYLALGRWARIEIGERDLVVSDAELTKSRKRFAVLVAAGDRAPTIDRIRAARALALARQGEVLVVRVVPLDGPVTLDQSRGVAERELEELTALVDSARPSGTDRDAGDEIKPLVRIAPTAAAGVLATASELDANLILLGWPGEVADPDREEVEHIAKQVFTATGRPVAVLRGRPPERFERVVVATCGGPHAPLGLELGAELAAAAGGAVVELVHVTRKGVGEEESRGILDRTLEGAGRPPGVKSATISARTPEEGLARAAGEKDLLILGASVDRLLMQTYLGGLAAEVAGARDRTTLLVKRAERVTRYLFRRLWEAISHPLPTVSVGDRSTVFADMRHAARADVDFYMLTLLASTIAILGLLLDSGAVIIGAMLVAPLMSPILAMAHGMVHGNLYMLHRGAASTFKGAALAVAVGTVVTLLQSKSLPTEQILARTEPNLLDLGVALAAGAAGAYALARKSVAAAVPGVAISVALVPPLCVVGFGLGISDFALAGGAMILFLTNLTGIVLVGALIFLLMGFRPSRETRSHQVKRSMTFALVAVVLLTIPLALQTRRQIREYRLENEIATVFRNDRVIERTRIADLQVGRRGDRYLVEAVLFVYRDVDAEDLESLKDHLVERVGVPVEIHATILKAESWSTDGP